MLALGHIQVRDTLNCVPWLMAMRRLRNGHTKPVFGEAGESKPPRMRSSIELHPSPFAGVAAKNMPQFFESQVLQLLLSQ